MWTLTVSSIRYHWRSFAGVFVTVVVSSTLVTMLGVMVESGIRGGVAPDRYRGADLVVAGTQSVPVPGSIAEPMLERVRLDRSALAAVAAVPGVVSAVGDVTVTLVNETGEPVEAHGWSSAVVTPYELVAGVAPGGPGEVVVDGSLGVEPGQSVSLGRGGHPVDYLVVGTVAPAEPRRDPIPTVFLTDEATAALSPRPELVDAVAVTLDDGVDADTVGDALASAVPGATVHAGRSRGDAERLDSLAARTELTALSASFGGVALMVALFVVAGSLALSVAQRERQYALLRAIGAEPGDVRAMVVREVGLVAAVAAVLGVGPGLVAAGRLGDAFASAGMIPEDFAFVRSPAAPLAAVALCLLTSLGAGLLVARRPAKTAPVAALRDSAVSRGRVGRVRAIAGWSCAAFGVVTSFTPLLVGGMVGAAAAAGAGLFLIMAVGLLGPMVVDGAVRILAPGLLRGRSAPAVLADATARTQTRRLAAAVVPLALAISLGCIQMFTPTTLAAEAERQVDAGLLADQVVTAPGVGIDPTWADTVAAVPGVTAVNAVSHSAGLLMTHLFGAEEEVMAESFPLTGVDPAALAATIDLDVAAGDPASLAGPDTVALSTDAATFLAIDVGEPLTWHLGDGTEMTSTVVATYRRGLGFGDVLIDGDLLRRHTVSGLADHLLVAGEADPDAVATAIGAGGTGLGDGRVGDGGVVVRPVAELAAAGEAERATQGWVSTLIALILLGYVAIAVVNTLVMVTLDRRREFSLLRMIGATDRQIRRSALLEAVTVALIAVVVGTLTAVPPLVGMAFALTGGPLPTVPPLLYLALVAATATIGIVSVGVPTRSVLRSMR